MTVTGSCLCGAVRYEVTGPFLDISRCHCSKCRKLSGSVGNASLFLPVDKFRWVAGQAHIREFTQESGWRSHFCGTCGSPVPGTNESTVAVPAGGLDGDPGVPIGVHIFVGSKAAWDVIEGDAPQYEESWV